MVRQGGWGEVGQDHVQQLMLTLHSFTMAFCIEKRNTWSQQTVVYILVETVLHSAVPRLLGLVRGKDCRDQQAALSSSSKRFSDGNSIKAFERIPSTPPNLSRVPISCRRSLKSKLSVPDLSHTAWRFSPNLRDKIRDGKPGFEAILEMSHAYTGPSWHTCKG